MQFTGENILFNNLHTKAGSVSSLKLNISAGPVPANSTLAAFSLAVTPPLYQVGVAEGGVRADLKPPPLNHPVLFAVGGSHSQHIPPWSKISE